jgi:carbonic anhydrase
VAAPVRDLIDRDYRHLGFDEIVDAAGQENVLFAIDNLHTYPAVRGRLEAGTLHVHAWFFKIASAELFAYEPILRQFLPLSKPSEATQPHQG